MTTDKTPTPEELEALARKHGATSYRNRADTQHPAYGFTEDGLRNLLADALAKWGSPVVATKVSIPTHTMEQEFQNHYRRGFEAGKKSTTPQPTQVQAGAVPLADEMTRQMKARCDSYEMRGAFADGWLSAEAAHGVKGETK